jgi:hypothetical protein
MRKAFSPFVGIAVAGATAMALAGTASPSSAACKAGMTTFGGASARVFCGSASATVHADGKTFTIREGSCEKGPDYLSINIGEVVLGTTNKPKPEYFGLNIGKLPYIGGAPASKDGTYHTGQVAVVHAGKGYPIRAQDTVTLSNGRSRGTFRATTLTGGVVSGSFAC